MAASQADFQPVPGRPVTAREPGPAQRVEAAAVNDRNRIVSPDGERIRVQLAPLYRLGSVIWLLYSLALLLTSMGSQLLAFAEPFRMVAVALTSITGVAMVIRVVSPGRPQWTRWTMPLIGGVATATFTLTLFASEMSGGLTAARAGFALLLLIPALGAYVSWISERAVSTL